MLRGRKSIRTNTRSNLALDIPSLLSALHRNCRSEVTQVTPDTLPYSQAVDSSEDLTTLLPYRTLLYPAPPLDPIPKRQGVPFVAKSLWLLPSEAAFTATPKRICRSVSTASIPHPLSGT